MINEEPNIEDIISGRRAANGQAQEKLYRNFYRSMMNLCLRYTKNETDAMAVLNTGFYKVFKTIQRYDSAKASLYTWIRTIIINSCLDHIKLKQKNLEIVDLTGTPDAVIDPEIISKFKSAHLLHLIRQLTPATQTVFNLFIIEGYSHKEIADLLRISIGTSKWHLSEGRKLLQKMINEDKVS